MIVIVPFPSSNDVVRLSTEGTDDAPSSVMAGAKSGRQYRKTGRNWIATTVDMPYPAGMRREGKEPQ